MAMQRLSPSRGQCSLSPTHSHGVLGIMRRRDGAGILLQHLVQGKTAHVHVLLFSEDDQVSLDVHCALRSSLPSHGHVELHGPVYRCVFFLDFNVRRVDCSFGMSPRRIIKWRWQRSVNSGSRKGLLPSGANCIKPLSSIRFFGLFLEALQERACIAARACRA